MPLPGLSLVGFIQDEQAAIRYLENSCIPPVGYTAQSLKKQWQDAKTQLGPAIHNSGKPDIQPIANSVQGYLGGVKNKKEYKPAFQRAGWDFKLVEIDKLLAFQAHVVSEQVDAVANDITDPNDLKKITEKCLPLQIPQYLLRPFIQGDGVMIRCPNLNVIIGAKGGFPSDPTKPNAPASVFGISLSAFFPFVEVARFEGRCFLKHGYHRVCGLRKIGVTHVPCVLREVSNYREAGVRDDGTTLDRTLLEGPNPPTCGHFTQARSCGVTLRRMAKIVHLMWAESTIPDE